MPRSSRFSVALHVLAHLVDAAEPQTSEHLAAYIGTNAVVVRRTLAGLREAGPVARVRGATLHDHDSSITSSHAD